MNYGYRLLICLFFVLLTSCSTNKPSVNQNGIPPAPSQILAVPSAGAITVTWQDNSDKETGFIIYREVVSSTLSSLGVEALSEVGANVTTFQDTSVSTTNSYRYGVAAKGELKSSETVLQTGSPVTPKPGTNPTVTTLSGKVHEWPGGNATLQPYTLAEGTIITKLNPVNISPIGEFSLDLPTELDDAALGAYSLLLLANCPGDVSVSSDVRSAVLGLEVLRGSTPLGELARAPLEAPEATDVFATFYLYADRAASITGSQTCIRGSARQTRNYRLILKRGWNQAVLKINAVNEETNELETSFTTDPEPAEATWYFIPADNPGPKQ